MRPALIVVAVSLAALAALAPGLRRVESVIAPPPTTTEPQGAWQLLSRELRSTLAALTLLRVEQIRHRGVYYHHADPEPAGLDSEERRLRQTLRPARLPEPEDDSWQVHSHYGGLFSHLHAFGARKHRHNVESEQLHEHPEHRLSHSHRTDPTVPHWHEEGEWAELVEHRHGDLVHTHRLGIWPHTHPDMETMPFALIHEADREKLASMEARTSDADPELAFSVVSPLQPAGHREPGDAHAHAHDHEHCEDCEHGAHEELECDHGGTLIPAQARDWRGIFGDLEREIHPYSTAHEHPDATGAISSLPWYKLGVVVDPHFIEGWKLGAAALRRDYGQIEPAIAFLREGLEKNPGNPELLVLLARAQLFNQRDYTAARETFEEAIRAARAGLAEQRYTSRHEAARWETAQLDSLRLLVGIHQREGRRGEALRVAREGLADFPDDPALREMLDELLLDATANPPR